MSREQRKNLQKYHRLTLSFPMMPKDQPMTTLLQLLLNKLISNRVVLEGKITNGKIQSLVLTSIIFPTITFTIKACHRIKICRNLMCHCLKHFRITLLNLFKTLTLSSVALLLKWPNKYLRMYLVRTH